jgi:hypothetical protein
LKPKISENKELLRSHKSYSVEEIFAAGGATAFGRKMEKNNEALIKALENAEPIEPFTDKEWADLMDQLAKDK